MSTSRKYVKSLLLHFLIKVLVKLDISSHSKPYIDSFCVLSFHKSYFYPSVSEKKNLNFHHNVSYFYY